MASASKMEVCYDAWDDHATPVSISRESSVIGALSALPVPQMWKAYEAKVAM